MKPSDLFTLKTSQAGIDLPIKFPDGTDTGITVKVRGTDSDEFKAANVKNRKNRVNIMALPEAEQESAFDDATRKLLASLVVSWTFEAKCTPEAVEELLREAPHVSDQINTFCGDRKNFFSKPPKN